MEGLGVGVAVGFLGALILFAIVFAATKRDSVASFISKVVKPNRRKGQDASSDVVQQSTTTLPEGLSEHDPPHFSLPTMYYRYLRLRVDPFNARTLDENLAGLTVTMDGIACTYIAKAFVDQKDVPTSAFDENKLVALAGDPANGGTWSEALSNKDLRGRAVKCFLAQVAFKRMHPSCCIEETLLPHDVAVCYRKVLECRSSDGKRLPLPRKTLG